MSCKEVKDLLISLHTKIDDLIRLLRKDTNTELDILIKEASVSLDFKNLKEYLIKINKREK
jgi:hypothetical protein